MSKQLTDTQIDNILKYDLSGKQYYRRALTEAIKALRGYANQPLPRPVGLQAAPLAWSGEDAALALETIAKILKGYQEKQAADIKS